MSIAGKWAYSRDEEIYHGAYDTPEDAAAAGIEEEHGAVYVGQFRDPTAPEDHIDFDPDYLFDQIYDADDYNGDWAEDWCEFTRDQAEELQAMLSQTLGEWLDKHKLRPKFGMVIPETVRRIETPCTEEKQSAHDGAIT